MSREPVANNDNSPSFKWLFGAVGAGFVGIMGLLWNGHSEQLRANTISISANIQAVTTLTANVSSLAGQVNDLKDTVKDLQREIRNLEKPNH